jgi:hypothetical protein
MTTDPAPDPADVPSDVDGSLPAAAPVSLPADAELAVLVAAMGAADRAMARVVALAGRLDGAQAAREEGMTVDGALRLHTGATRSDVSAVLTAAQVLSAMPVTAALFDRGIFTWGHVRSLIVQARRLDVATRRELDGYLGEHAEKLARLDTDGRLAAIDDAIAHHTAPEKVADRAERLPDHNVVVVTPRLDGTGSLYTDLDPESFATVTGRLQAEADTPLAPPCPGNDADGLPGHTRDRPSRGRQLAEALVRIFARTGSDGRGGAPVRFTVIVDADRVTDQAAGTIATAVASRPPRVVRRALARLACDATLDLVIRDGVDLLAAKRYAPQVTAATRRAVEARDQGCRFPGCRAPAGWCDVHHVTPRAAGGDHAVTNLVLLCRTHHTIVHRRGWNQHLEPDGTYRLTRRGRTWSTLPRLHAQLPPPTRAGPAPCDRIPTGIPGSRRTANRRPTTTATGEPLPF